MSDLSNKTALVFDHGLFIGVARRLAQAFGKVYYHSTWERAFPVAREACIGDGFTDIERVAQPLSKINEVDLWVFPDVLHSALQLHLESLGKRVWGSRRADTLELDREKFLRCLAEVGLEVPKYKSCKGISELADYLKTKQTCFIKISLLRGDLETTPWHSYRRDSGFLDWLQFKFGPLAEHIAFIVCDEIPGDLELGGDTYNVDGSWPQWMIHGLENKDKSYFGAVTERGDMPEDLQKVMDAFAPLLKVERYRNQWSMEVRPPYFIDGTTRGGLPSTPSQLALWRNFPEIVWEGADGNLVEPEFQELFSMEVAISAKGNRECWTRVELPEELEPWCQFGSCCMVDRLYCFPPDDSHCDEIGWLHYQDKTPRATLEGLKELADKLPPGLSANLEALVGVIQEIESADEQGIKFTAKDVPEAAEVIE